MANSDCAAILLQKLKAGLASQKQKGDAEATAQASFAICLSRLLHDVDQVPQLMVPELQQAVLQPGGISCLITLMALGKPDLESAGATATLFLVGHKHQDLLNPDPLHPLLELLHHPQSYVVAAVHAALLCTTENAQNTAEFLRLQGTQELAIILRAGTAHSWLNAVELIRRLAVADTEPHLSQLAEALIPEMLQLPSDCWNSQSEERLADAALMQCLAQLAHATAADGIMTEAAQSSLPYPLHKASKHAEDLHIMGQPSARGLAALNLLYILAWHEKVSQSHLDAASQPIAEMMATLGSLMHLDNQAYGSTQVDMTDAARTRYIAAAALAGLSRSQAVQDHICSQSLLAPMIAVVAASRPAFMLQLQQQLPDFDMRSTQTVELRSWANSFMGFETLNRLVHTAAVAAKDQHMAAIIITHLAANGQFAAAVAQLDALPPLKRLVTRDASAFTAPSKGSLNAATAVSLILAALNSRIDLDSLQICHPPSLQCLLAALSDDGSEAAQSQAASILAFAIQHTACQREVVKQGGVPVLIELLGSAPASVSASCVTAVLALTRLPEGCEELLLQNALPALLAVLNRPIVGAQRHSIQLSYSIWAHALEAVCNLASMNIDDTRLEDLNMNLDDLPAKACQTFFKMLSQQLDNRHDISTGQKNSSSASPQNSSILILLELLASDNPLSQAQAAMWTGCLALSYLAEVAPSVQDHEAVIAAAERQLQQLQHSPHANVRQACLAALGLFAEKAKTIELHDIYEDRLQAVNAIQPSVPEEQRAIRQELDVLTQKEKRHRRKCLQVALATGFATVAAAASAVDSVLARHPGPFMIKAAAYTALHVITLNTIHKAARGRKGPMSHAFADSRSRSMQPAGISCKYLDMAQCDRLLKMAFQAVMSQHVSSA
ncbi:hypothetical protein WJX74_003282 [Apatococcus lobatus]|uniref:Uncharacterized protein n=1 Tax=Apatococcus lobatus TaxID=904363 RepID=A0AAW1RH78_9CHLO